MGKPLQFTGLDDPALAKILSEDGLQKLRDEAELAQGGYSTFDAEAYRQRRSHPDLFRLGAEGFRRRRS